MTGPASTPVTLRIYGSDGSGSPTANTANWRIDDINLIVTTAGGCTTPTASVSGDATICDGGSTTIQAELTGTGPWDVTWSDSVTQTGVVSSPATRTVSPTTTTAYTVTSVADASGCPSGTGTGSATVTVNQPVAPSVSVTANPGTTTCTGNEVVFTAVAINGGVTPTYLWKTNGVEDSSVPNTSATYTNSSLVDGDTIDCELTTSLTCVTTTTADAPQLTMTITTSVTPLVSVASDHGTTICAGTTVIFTATPVYGGSAPNYVWKTNGVPDTSVPGSSATYTNSNLANGDTLDCQLISNDACALPATAEATPIVMTVNATFIPSVTIAADPGAIICSNSSVTFTATPVNGGAAPTYQWQTNNVDVTGQTASTFTTASLKNLDAVTVALVPSAEICVSPATAISDAITITVNPIPSSTITTASGVVHDSTGNAASVPDAGVGGTYVWTIAGGSITAGQDTPSLTYTAGSTIGTLTLGCTVTSAAGCNSVSSTNVQIHAPILAGWDVSTLPGGLNNYGPSPLSPTAMDANLTVGGLTRGSGVGTNGTAAARAWGGLGWTVTNAADAVTAEKFATFTVTANTGTPVSFNAITELNYRRSGTGATNGVIQYQVGGADTFHDLATVSYPSSASTGGSLGPIDLSGIPALQDVAGGTVVTFRIVNFGGTSSAGTWYIYDVGNSPAADFEISGYVGGCVAPTATLAGDSTICEGTTADLTTTLTGTQPWSVTWSDGITSNNITSSPFLRTVSPSSTTVYTVTSVSDAINCAVGTFSGSATVTVNPLPTVSVNSDTICAGGSAILTATTSADNPSYLWSPGGETTAAITVSPATTTIYSVTVTDGTTSCENSGSGTVTVNPLPTVSVNSAAICTGDSTLLTATTSAGSPSYLWSPGGETTAAITVSPTITTIYSVTVTDGVTGCVNSGGGSVMVSAAPDVTTDTTNQVTCAGSEVTWTVTTSASGVAYQWQRDGTNLVEGVGNFTGTTTATLTNAAASTEDAVDEIHGYACVISVGTCTASSTLVSLTVNALPTVTIIPAATNVACAGTVTFTADPAGDGPLTYQWYDNLTNAIPGETNLTLTVMNVQGAVAGNYSIVVTGPFCSAKAVASLTVDDTVPPVITINGENPATNECHVAYTDAGVTVSDACASGISVATTSDVDANVPGNYTVTYTADDGNGNTNTAIRTVYVVDTIAPTITVLGANPYTNYSNVPFVDPGATATDACDVSVALITNGTVNVTIPGSYALDYVGTDASGNSVTNSRTVVVIALVAPTIANGQKLADGAFEVTFAGPDGQPYQLLTTTDATLEISSWTVLTTGVFGDSLVTYTDNSATNDPVRFYRVSSP